MINVLKCYSLPTGETFLQFRPSKVVEDGGCDTGRGVFTLKEIPANTWICAYGPSAPIEPLMNDADDTGDYFIKLKRKEAPAFIDGTKCCLGLGRMINDGKTSKSQI